jgi:hypothetical protein
MSKTKYVEFGGTGFWTFDIGLGVFLKHLIDVALRRAAPSDEEWIAAGVNEWRRAAAIPDIGLEIDSSWSSSQLATFAQFVGEACAVLGEREVYTAEEITSWTLYEDLRLFPRGYALYPTAPVIELGTAIVALINGSLPAAPPGRQWLYGAPEGRTTI